MIALFVTAAIAAAVPTPGKGELKAPQPVAQTKLEQAVSTLHAVAVTVECTARPDGHVENCAVLDETHPGLGFGETAVALMQDSEVAPGPAAVRFAHTIQFMP